MYSLFRLQFLSFAPSILGTPALFILILIFALIAVKAIKDYKGSSYYEITKLSYFSVRFDKGRYGEYLTYKNLRHMESSGAKFLFNVYIPKSNGETTEIDVLMICSKGIFVFESKNYSGWIFGSEGNRYWYQTLPSGRGKSHKEQFYNPIMQNRSHIKNLSALLDLPTPMWSVITFSDRCTLKKVDVYSKDVKVINRNKVAHTVSAICNQTADSPLTSSRVLSIFNQLYPYTQVDENIKAAHITNIHNQFNSGKTRPIHTDPTATTRPTKDVPMTVAATQEELHPTIATDLTMNTDSSTSDVTAPVPAPEEPFTTNEHICPRCGGALIQRTASRGVNAGNKFYGCSNYPRCKYIQNIPQQ